MPANPTPEELAAWREKRSEFAPNACEALESWNREPRLIDALEASEAKVKSLEEELVGVGADLNRALTEIP